MRQPLWIIFSIIAAGLFGGCALTAPQPTFTPLPPTATQSPPTITLSPTASQTPTRTPYPTRAPSQTPTTIPPDTGWQTIQPGLERREINFFNSDGFRVEQFTILRVAPENFSFDIAYSRRPKSLEDWYAETGASVIINGGYFRVEGETYLPTGLTIINGEVLGNSYGEYAGMLAISEYGPELRWLAQDPYYFGEPLRAALQSFPILVKPGGVLGFPEQFEDFRDARRTVIGRDLDGRFIFLVASRGYFTLHRLSKYLTEADLALDFAFNLDGGPSSGLLIAEPWELIPAYSPLPVVITLTAR